MSVNFREDPALQVILQELESERKVLHNLVLRSIIIASIGLLIIIASFLFGLASSGAPLLGAAFLVFSLLPIAGKTKVFKVYKESFKMKVIGSALKLLDPSLIIEPENGLTVWEFSSAQLFNRNPDRYNSEDQVSGTAGKTRFYFSEVHAEYKTERTDKDGKTSTTWSDIFRGIIFTADFNKNFNGITKVRPKNIGTTIGSWISKAAPSFLSGEGELIQLENLEFSNQFITHSTDQVEARYILTPALMDKICLLNKNCGDTVSVTFIRSRIYIVFPMKDNFFEPPIFKSLIAPDCLQKDFHIIQFMYDIITELDLNTRIWGKE